MKPIPYGRQCLDEDDIQAVAEVLRGDWLTTGPFVEEFEKKVANYCGARFGVAFNSGTSALHGAVLAAGIAPGDEVITTPLSFVATSNCVEYVGSRPIFVDIDPQTYCIDCGRVAEAITSATKAIIPVDYAGYPLSMRDIKAITAERNILLIEDAAHALGASDGATRIGRRADMTMLSFHPVKHVTTGEGGIILTDREDLNERLRLYRSHGIVRKPDQMTENHGPWYYEMHHLGLNYRITDIQCALGTSQMDKLEKFLVRRNEIAAYYDKSFANIFWLKTPPRPENGRHAYHLYPVLVLLPGEDDFSPYSDFDRLMELRARFFSYLRDNGILAQVHYLPIHLQPYYRSKYGYKPGDYPVAESFYAREVSLPMFPGLSDSEVEYVVDAVKRFLY
ncbi:MAG: UDP-4-amino-4,6-dideoxy-N-acetyl-beta-L-altrosamine transaminase [Candidatus Saccharibacteria bacterium]